MPTFLTQSNIYKIINQELPEGLFAFSPAPNTFYVTAEMDSYAATISDTYLTAMQPIYTNMFVTTADEKIADFETMYFGSVATASLTLAERRARILAKIRSQAFVSLWDILTFTVSYLPVGTYAQIVEYGSYYGQNSWIINQDGATAGQSNTCELGTQTFIGYETPQQLIGPNADQVWAAGWVYLDPLPAGVSGDPAITQATLLAIRQQAYTYEIRIFGYTMPTDLQMLFEKDLLQIHPVRSQYLLSQNQVLSDYNLNTDVNNVNQFTTYPSSFGVILPITCIKADATQTTGYKGKVYTG